MDSVCWSTFTKGLAWSTSVSTLLIKLTFSRLGGRHRTEVAFALFTQLARIRFTVFPSCFRIRISRCHRDLSTSVHCLVWGQCMKCLIVDRTHLVLASGKLVLQKKTYSCLTRPTRACHFLFSWCLFAQVTEGLGGDLFSALKAEWELFWPGLWVMDRRFWPSDKSTPEPTSQVSINWFCLVQFGDLMFWWLNYATLVGKGTDWRIWGMVTAIG